MPLYIYVSIWCAERFMQNFIARRVFSRINPAQGMRQDKICGACIILRRRLGDAMLFRSCARVHPSLINLPRGHF